MNHPPGSPSSPLRSAGREPAPTRRELAPTRRELAIGTLAAGALAAAPGARTRARGRADGEPWFRISLAQWSLHRALRSGELDALDFAPFTKREFGLEGVEYVNQFFADKAGDFGYLRELRRRAEDSGVQSLVIMIDAEGALGNADDAARRRAIERHFKWIAAAGFLGCHSIRVNAGGEGTREDVAARASDSLHRLCGMGDDYDVNVIVENHGGYSSDGSWLAGVIRGADHPRCGTLPDFGNFNLGNGEQYDRYKGVEELMPYAKAVSAKSHEFDGAGNEVRTDYRRMLRIVHDAGYREWIGVEYEGDQVPEAEGIRLTRDLLLRVAAEQGEAR